jgi:hypothetical protein
MNSTRCPKCGSDQIRNDECLKCGVLISRVPRRSNPSDPLSSGSISFVDPSRVSQPIAVPVPPAPSAKKEIPTYQAAQKSNLQRNLVWGGILLLLLTAGYQVYRYFLHQASLYNGYYWNDRLRFSLIVPDSGWSHYQSSDLQSLDFKDAKDGFYKGKDPDDPELAMVVWTEHTRQPYPPRFDSDTSERILQAIEEEVLQRMTKAKLAAEISESNPIRLGGNDGFVLHANLRDGHLKTIIYCAFNERIAYTVQFLGQERLLKDTEEEIDGMMTTFDFQKTLF